MLATLPIKQTTQNHKTMETKKYVVNIGGTSNSLSDPNFFIGTGFMGDTFDTRDELIALLHKYATFEKEDKKYWREEIKMTFSLGSTLSKFKKEGNRQCKENGGVNLFALAFVGANDPFRNIEVIYRPGGWIDKEGNEFKFVLITGKEREVTPKKAKLSEILREIGMEI